MSKSRVQVGVHANGSPCTASKRACPLSHFEYPTSKNDVSKALDSRSKAHGKPIAPFTPGLKKRIYKTYQAEKDFAANNWGEEGYSLPGKPFYINELGEKVETTVSNYARIKAAQLYKVSLKDIKQIVWELASEARKQEKEKQAEKRRSKRQ